MIVSEVVRADLAAERSPQGLTPLGDPHPAVSDSLIKKVKSDFKESLDTFKAEAGVVAQIEGIRAEKGTMRLKMKRLALITIFTVCAKASTHPQSVVDALQPLVEMSAKRLVIAEQVALAKWDSETSIEDVSREAQVILDVAKKAEGRGLDQKSVGSFFKAQIEACKLVQYSLFAEWRRAGRAPDHKPINLAITIRPELDQVDASLIEELAETAQIRASASCRIDMAKAVGKFLSAYSNNFSAVKGIALDRALATACK